MLAFISNLFSGDGIVIFLVVLFLLAIKKAPAVTHFFSKDSDQGPSIDALTLVSLTLIFITILYLALNH